MAAKKDILNYVQNAKIFVYEFRKLQLKCSLQYSSTCLLMLKVGKLVLKHFLVW